MPHGMDYRSLRMTGITATALVLAGAAVTAASAPRSDHADAIAFANRMSWGATASGSDAIVQAGPARWLDQQLRLGNDAPLPTIAAAQIAAMRITREPMAGLVMALDGQNKAAGAIADPDERKAAREAYQKALADLDREAQTRSLLRDLYSPAQLREQMTWFWANHFNVQAGKRDIRAMIGDYEDQAIRPRALGRFRDLLEATLRHPAMLRYLDNDQNAAGRINENYAREIMELHAMGVGAGYTQGDVQELARILTGVGVSLRPDPPHLKPEWQPLYFRQGLFEFNPARHDFGIKTFLGHVIRGQGYAEVQQALDLIARSPATARHVSAAIATFLLGEDPSPALLDRLAGAFRRSDGDTAAVIRELARSPEFARSLGHGFKDPVHYVVSALRLAYDDRVILNADPAIGWLNRMGEGLFAHETPDGYPLAAAAWSGPGQMSVRFEVARQIGAGAAGLFRPRDAAQPAASAFPQVQNALYYRYFAGRLAPASITALGQAGSQAEWNTLFLSSPDFMRR